MLINADKTREFTVVPGDTSQISNYVRLNFDNIPIYVYPDKPDWFVPTQKADQLLQNIQNDFSIKDISQNSKELFLAKRFLSTLARPLAEEYTGRASKLKLDKLKECWFHITNQCNLKCRYCLFSSSINDTTALPLENVLESIEQLQKLGCKVIYFTGGEPFIYYQFERVVKKALETPDCHVVVLTNGLLIKHNLDWLNKLDKNRIHFQVSLDGAKESNDKIRGNNTYEKIIDSVKLLKENSFNVSLSMLVENTNYIDMSSIVDIAAELDVRNVHFMWFFQKGKGSNESHVETKDITSELLKAYKRSKETGVLIDNIEILKSQIFSLAGTKFDLNNSGWESIAIGTNGNIYPSPATIGEEKVIAGNISEGIENVWRNSRLFKQIRQSSLIHYEKYNSNPLRFLIGGGDIDQDIVGGSDYYLDVYNNIALKLIADEANQYKDSGKRIGLLARMGELVFQCDEGMGEVSFTHSNCVLSLANKDGHSVVRSFYSAAAEEPNEEIFNPVAYEESQIGHIPEEARVRSYGCGSPVFDADLKQGEILIDLGSGTGIECFVAAKKVGRNGKVVGIDMSDTMLAVANKSKDKVAENLGYNNIEFIKAFFEEAPIKDNTADILISNCVLNLSPNKRKTFSQIYRMLKPGGRAVISDICYEDEIPLEIKYNEKLRGECIGGAFKQDELFALLRDIEFESIKVLKRFPYRDVYGYTFYSITYSMKKPSHSKRSKVLYRGPFAAVVTEDGQVIHRGESMEIQLAKDLIDTDSLFVLDKAGRVTNVKQQNSCCCIEPMQESENRSKHIHGCMVCGTRLTYLQKNENKTCYYCRQQHSVNAVCENDHFVCDKCHAYDAIEIIKQVCLSSSETDMIKLMKKVRTHGSFPINGPEHHSMVPAIILTAYKNLMGKINNDDIIRAIERGNSISGGACAFWGSCGAAMGVGIAFSIIIQADPYKAKQRQKVQQLTTKVLSEIAKFKAPRCCQRDCWIGIKQASVLSDQFIGVHLKADEKIKCCQYEQNGECIKQACPLWNE